MESLLIGINSKYIHPAMGIFQIYTNCNYRCSYKEFTIKDDIDNIINYIENENFDILGFSVYIWNIEMIKEILSKLNPNITIVLGGPEASYRVNDFLIFKNVTYIIKDEGEEAFNSLIKQLKSEKDFSLVPNLYYRLDSKFIYTFSRTPNINKIKYDYSLIGDFKNRVIYLEASRGCPFKCSYCLASLEKRVRYLSHDFVKASIKEALEKGARTIKFLDRSFNINQKQMLDILNFIKENDNLKTVYQFEVVGDLLDNETIAFLKTIRKGLIRFEIGIQSLNPKTTKAVNRTQNITKLIENINLIKDNIVIHLDLIAGLPYEDLSSFKNTFNQTFMLFADELQLGFLKELQGTQISLTKGIHNYNFSSTSPYEVIDNKYISKEELDEIRFVEAGLNKFYNSNNYSKTMDYIFNILKLNPFDFFNKLTKFIGLENLKKYQLPKIADMLYEFSKTMTKNSEEIYFLIKQDYLMKFNHRPQIFWQTNISKKERFDIYTLFMETNKDLTFENLYNYARLEKYNNQYFLIVYKPTKEIYYLKRLSTP